MNNVNVRSRKFRYALCGIGIIVFIYLLNLILITKFPDSQASYIALFNTLVPFIAGIIAILLGTHTFMDWRASVETVTNIQNSVESVKEIHAPKHYDDDTI